MERVLLSLPLSAIVARASLLDNVDGLSSTHSEILYVVAGIANEIIEAYILKTATMSEIISN